MTFGKFTTHPAADVFPLLAGPEFDELVESIRVHGLREKIKTFGGQILDGRNRLAACEKAEVEPEFEAIDEDENPFDYAWTMNGGRRHLTSGQKAAARVALMEKSEEWKLLIEENRAKRKAAPRLCNSAQTEAPNGKSSTSTKERQKSRTHAKEKIAADAGVSARTAQDAITVGKKAPALLDQVAKGEIPLAEAVAQANGSKQPAAGFDSLGHDVPVKLAKAWAAIESTIKQIDAHLIAAQSDWTKAVKALEPIGKDLGGPAGVAIGRFLYDGSKILRGEDGNGGIGFDSHTLRSLAPHSVCLKCHGAGCMFCNRTGTAIRRDRAAVEADAKAETR